MKKIVAASLFLLSSMLCFAQPNLGNLADGNSRGSKFQVGIMVADFSKFNTQMKSDYGVSFDSLLIHYGTSSHTDADGAFHFYNGINFIHPQKVRGDSADYRLSGWEWNIGLFGGDLFKNADGFDLFFSIGFNVGRLRMDQSLYDGKNIRYTNPFFAPFVQLEPCIVFGSGFNLGVRGFYQYDVSDPDWNIKNADRLIPPLGKAFMTGWSAQLVIGFSID
jgi:hypothetical protein